MSTQSNKIKVKETATKFRLLQCMRLLGDLSVHLNGENKVMFKTKDDETYFTYYGITLSGDQGCVKPLDDAPCALDELKRVFGRFEPWMYQNDESQEHYITEEFKHWITNDVAETVHKHFIEDERTEIVTCEYYPKGEQNDPLAVVTVTAMTNPYAITLYEELDGSVYVGKISEVINIGSKILITFKTDKQEKKFEIEVDEDYLIIGTTDIKNTMFIYRDVNNRPVFSSVLLHDEKCGLSVTSTTVSKKKDNIVTLTDKLNINPNLSHEERTKVKWDYIQQHPNEEHWDYAEHYGYTEKEGRNGKTSKWIGVDHRVMVSTKGRLLITYLNGKKAPVAFTGAIERNTYCRFKFNGKSYSLHRVVASTFIPTGINMPQSLVPNHKNGKKYDNNVFNLEWATYSKNAIHAYSTGLATSKKYLFTVVANNVFEGRQFVILNPSEILPLLNMDWCSLSSTYRDKYNTVKGFKIEEILDENVGNYTIGMPNEIIELYQQNSSYFHYKTKAYLGTVIDGIDKGKMFVVVGKHKTREYGFNKSNIVECCKGKRKQHKNCTWECISLKEAVLYPQTPPVSIFISAEK